MKREPTSVKKIFRSYLIVIGLDLIFTFFATIIYEIQNQEFLRSNSSENIFISTKYVAFSILGTLAFVQSFSLLPVALILLFTRKWEIAVGIILAELTMVFLGALLCGGVLG